MKQTILFMIILTAFLFISQPLQAVTTLSKGMPINDWLNQDDATYIQTTRYTLTDFQNIKSLGCDHVRFLVNLNIPQNAAPAYDLDPVVYSCLDKAIGWAKEVGLKVVITATGFDIAEGNWEVVVAQLSDNWKDIAGRYQAEGDVVLYELFSYPVLSQLPTATWKSAEETLISSIRQVDTKHTIIVGAPDYNVATLVELGKLADENLLYTFEFFDPVTFTRQGTTYQTVTYNTVVVPFPYDAGKMPAMDAADAGTAAEQAYNNYPANGNAAYVQQQLNSAFTFATTNGVSLYCASLGVAVGTQFNGWDVPAADRAAWYTAVRTALESNNAGWCMANYRGNFSIFYDYGTGTENWMQFSNYQYDANQAIATALGFTAPPTSEVVPIEITGDLVLYDDEFTSLTRISWWLGDGYPDFFVTDNPAVGKYCMGIYYPGQWCAVDFFFPIYLDMQKIMDEGYLLDLFIRCEYPDAHIEARFEDTNTDLEDRPWRMNFHIDNTVVPFDGEWQRFTMALADLQDMGAWDPDDQTWYGGPGQMVDWTSVQRFQFVSETAAQPDAEIFIDRLRIVSPTAIDKKPGENPSAFRLEANYPNPFNASTVFEFNLPDKAKTQLSIYNIQGQLVKTLVSSSLNAGVYQYSWDGVDESGHSMPSGVYFYELKTDNQKLVRQMALIR
jgi:endoglucanase